MSLHQDLKNFLLIMGRASMSAARGWAYPSVFHFVLEHGTDFESQLIPPDAMEVLEKAVGRRKLPVKCCFQNAADVVLSDDTGRLSYCEGYGIRLIPAHHAWVVIDGIYVADVTWNRLNQPLMSSRLSSKILGVWKSDDVAYVGVQFSRKRLSAALTETEVYGSLLLDEVRNFPLYRTRFDEEAEKAADKENLIHVPMMGRR